MLTALGGAGNNQESLLDLLMYIGEEDDYKATWEEAVKSNGLVLPTLDGVATLAIQSTCNMNKSQMRQPRWLPQGRVRIYGHFFRVQNYTGPWGGTCGAYD
jgi:hypothetical protein